MRGKLFAIVLLAALDSLLSFAGSARAAQTLDEVSQLKCADILPADDGTPAGKFTRTTLIMLTWLAGYRDGIAALGSVDPRFQMVGKTELPQFGALVIAYCKAKPTLNVGEAVTGVFEFTINSLPGERVDLALPPK
jgi:hypothetical protein